MLPATFRRCFNCQTNRLASRHWRTARVRAWNMPTCRPFPTHWCDKTWQRYGTSFPLWKGVEGETHRKSPFPRSDRRSQRPRIWHLAFPMIAGGHSFGGRLTSMAAAAEPIPNVRGLFFCSYPLHAPGSPSDQRAIHLPQVSVPMLFVSGTRDRMMTFDLLQPTLIALGSNATFKWLETGDHSYQTLKRKRSIKIDIFDQLARAISGWFLTLK